MVSILDLARAKNNFGGSRLLNRSVKESGDIKTAKQSLLLFITNAIEDAEKNLRLKVKSVTDLRALANIIKVLEDENVAVDPVKDLIDEIKKLEDEGKG